MEKTSFLVALAAIGALGLAAFAYVWFSSPPAKKSEGPKPPSS